MLLLQIRDHRDLHLDDLDRRDVELHQLMDLNCDMDRMHLVHLLHLDAVQIHLDVLVLLRLQDVVRLVVLQNLDVEHLDVEHLDVLHPLDVVVDVELHHQLRMDYFLDVEDVGLLPLPRMDCYLDVVLVHLEQEVLVLVLVLLRLQVLQVNLELQCMQLVLLQLLALLHVMPSALQDPHRALLQVLQRVLGLPQTSLEQQPSSLQLS